MMKDVFQLVVAGAAILFTVFTIVASVAASLALPIALVYLILKIAATI